MSSDIDNCIKFTRFVKCQTIWENRKRARKEKDREKIMQHKHGIPPNAMSISHNCMSNYQQIRNSQHDRTHAEDISPSSSLELISVSNCSHLGEFFYLSLSLSLFSSTSTSAAEQSFVPVDHVAGTLILTYIVISRGALAISVSRSGGWQRARSLARMCDNRGRESLTYR